MIIYQVRCCGGEWEDSFNHSIKPAYFDKEKAEIKKNECEREENINRFKHKMCNECDREYWEHNACYIRSSKKSDFCSNYFEQYDDEEFYIDEIEVEE